MKAKIIQYFGVKCAVVCDGNCGKAWGINSRPKNQLSDDTDDYIFRSDDDLGDAPECPGTWEGGHGKPAEKSECLNKWCVRECERAWIVRNGPVEFDLEDMANPTPNIPRSK